jgi:hypothetical protein
VVKSDIEALAKKLTRAAVTAFSNPMIFVYEKVGVFWLAERTAESFYTFDSVGIPKAGIRKLTAEVQRIAAERPRPAKHDTKEPTA